MARLGRIFAITGGALALIGIESILGHKKAGAVPGGWRGSRQDPMPPLPEPVYRPPVTDTTPAGPTGPIPTYTPATWTPIIARLIAAEFPRVNAAFANGWNTFESDGQPGAVGNPGALGPDGNPVEIGLGQLYNPDDFTNLKAPPAAAFRAYCPDARPLSIAYNEARGQWSALKKQGVPDTDPRVIDAHHRMAVASRTMQTVTRALTSAEMDDQVRWTLLAKIAQCMHEADQVVARYSLSHWTLADYYKLVKAPHALPAILHAMGAVVAKLGHPPASWHEFRVALGMDGNAEWNRALNACEKCGNVVAPAVV